MIPARYAVFAESHITYRYERANSVAFVVRKFGVILGYMFSNFRQGYDFSFRHISAPFRGTYAARGRLSFLTYSCERRFADSANDIQVRRASYSLSAARANIFMRLVSRCRCAGTGRFANTYQAHGIYAGELEAFEEAPAF